MKLDFEYETPTGRKGIRRWVFQVADGSTGKALMTFDCGKECHFPEALSALKKQLSGAAWIRSSYKVVVK